MIRIVTDSTADLPQELIDAHAVTVVPLSVRFGEREYVDREELSNADFWRMLGESEHLPETSAPSAGRFQDVYLALADEGATGIVVVCLSSRLSATYQSAVIAAEKVAETIPVTVVDSFAVSMAAGFQVLEAARAAEAGSDLATVAGAATAAAPKTNLIAALDTLEYLRRGGRIGSAQAMVGSLLNVKPLITFGEGVVMPAGRVRTRGKALAAVVDHIAGLESVAEVCVLHGQADDVDQLRDRLLAYFPMERVLVAELGPVVATHGGPGVIGVAYRLD